MIELHLILSKQTHVLLRQDQILETGQISNSVQPDNKFDFQN